MISIVKAKVENTALLAEIAKQSFIESHGSSAPPEDIEIYTSAKYNTPTLANELLDTKNNYHLVYYNNQIAGFSNIMLNTPFASAGLQNIAKLDRIFLLKDFYNLKIGLRLFQFNIDLAKQNNQTGVWLFVWIENHKAISFYKQNGFEVIGNFNFKISETHYNPNYQMLLTF